MMKSFFSRAVLVLVTASSLAFTSARSTFNINPSWKLHVGDVSGAESTSFDDSTWLDVTLPHAWNEDDAFLVSIANLSTGIAWYRKTFIPPSGGKYFLEFEGIRQAGELYLNGEFIGRSENGVMAFGFDITKLTVPNEENVLAARINNSYVYRDVTNNGKFQWNNIGFYANYGGINKNVYLHVTDQLYQTLPLYSNLNTTGVYVYASEFDILGKSATITSSSQV
ncbi:hypothetical protein PFICI_02986 [Pestalotiopsis fici W106-1]|uniref:Beta-mannosidase-like galactose-binding domain-containing protein n=1 Tax=Pestalotiopsis fici (strain W106-1 / CGMCC3.15140) TaxID=1229662 RepID=W3XI83_PESFW|nr:uncharacterized protein PFICI_02986 [Pestalotiopsis fici W106-1]ETS84961.1 hypothetical protein PFICI_02986 [Pestalotiopsis fici W106-1]